MTGVAPDAALGPTAVVQAREGAGPVQALLVGDSILSGLARSYGAPGRAVLGARHPFLLDAAGCRRLITTGCRLGAHPPAHSALSVVTAHAGEPIRALVVAAGYNDMSTGSVGVATAVDRITAAARDQAIEHVVWLTYREAGDDAHLAQYRGHNDVLRAKAAADPTLHVADWAAVSRALPSDWFSADGLHLGADSARALAELIADTLDDVLGPTPPSRPVAGDSHLTVLLPARNAAHLLPDWLDDAASYADAVIALDDGSTDRTRDILEAHPLVTRVLTRPVRPTYHGWDDLGNRQQLVDAARDAGARWLLFLDADERIDHTDAKELRRFLETDAQPGFAYGFEVFRMIEDHRHYDPRSLWVFRLFSADDADTELGSQRLHFVPVPSGIPRQRWLFTSIRIQHFGSLTVAHRQARFEKYREADPHNECQNDYTGLLDDPVVAEWPERPGALPVLLGTEGRYADQHGDDDSEGDTPAITAVVIAQDDVDVIDRSLRALVSQEVEDEFEVIVVCSGSDGTFERVRDAYPQARCVQLPDRALPGEARNAGLWMANGEYVTFPGSHVWLMPGSLQARLDTHDDGWDLVTGSVVNGNTTRAGWASYLLDHAAQAPTRASGEFGGVPGHASYITRDVRAVGGFPEDMRAGEDTVVNRKLYFAGKRTYFCVTASFAHATPSTGLAHLLRHHFQRGRALGRIIRTDSTKSRLALLRSTKSLPKRRLRHIATSLDAAGEELGRRYRGLVRAYAAAGAVAAATGTWFQLLTGTATAPSVGSTLPAIESGPLLVIAGRPGEAATGLLAAGSAKQTAGRLLTLARYARSVGAVRPALAPIVTSATVTSEHAGTNTVDLPQSIVDTYLRAARDIGALLLLHIQPGTASLAAIVDRWADLLEAPDVGVLFDLRPEVAFADQRDELDDAVRRVREVGGEDTVVAVRGVDAAPTGTIVVPQLFDLRRPGTPYPHDALAADPRLEALVYQ